MSKKFTITLSNHRLAILSIAHLEIGLSSCKKLIIKDMIKLTRKLRLFVPVVVLSHSLSAQANMVGVDMQNFNPSYSVTDYTTVHSSRTLQAQQFHLGLFFDQAINSIVYYDNNKDVPQSRTDFNDHISSMAAHMAMGITNNWDVGISLPFVLKQSVKQSGNRIQYFDTGIADIRISTKYRLWSDSTSGIAVVGSGSINKVRNNPFTGEGSSRVFTVEMVGDHKFGKTLVAANVGYRYRTEGEPLATYPIEPINNQVIGSIGVHQPFYEKFAFIGEIYGGKPMKSGRFDSDRSLAAGEVTAGVNYYPHKGLALHAGAGTELFSGLFTPAWRFFAGVNWTFPVEFPKRPEPKPEKFERITLQEVLFKYNSDNPLGDKYKKHVEILVKALNTPSLFKSLTIEGHSCSLGSEDYNRDLSQRRANRIKEILVTNYKIPAEKITAIGYGESQPVETNATDEGRRRNRRVEFKIFRDE